MAARVALVPLIAAFVSLLQLLVFLSLHHGWLGVRTDVSRYTAYKNHYPLFIVAAAIAAVGSAWILRGVVGLVGRLSLKQTRVLGTVVAFATIGTISGLIAGDSYRERAPLPAADEFALAAWAKKHVAVDEVEVVSAGLNGYTLSVGVLGHVRDLRSIKRLEDSFDVVDRTSIARRYFLAASTEQMRLVDPAGELAVLPIVARAGRAVLYDVGDIPVIAGRLDVVSAPRVSPDGTVSFSVEVTNTGRLSWPPDGLQEKGAVRIAGRLRDLDGTLKAVDVLKVRVQQDRAAPTAPGERVVVPVEYRPPPGRHLLELDLLREDVSFFARRYGSVVRRIPVGNDG